VIEGETDKSVSVTENLDMQPKNEQSDSSKTNEETSTEGQKRDIKVRDITDCTLH
jgi:hypothetical protein